MPTIIYIIFPMFLIFQDNYLESASKTLKYVGEQLYVFHDWVVLSLSDNLDRKNPKT